MSLANMKRPGFWYALIWKDVHQLKQITSYLAAGLLAIQAILLLLCIFGPEAMRPDSMVFQWVIASTGLFIFFLAAPAMAAGHERQMGTWTWQSSLPQSWLHSLASKIAATSLVGILFAAALCVLPTISIILFRGSELSITTTNSERLWGVLAFVCVALEVAAISTLGSLLFREPLNGMLSIGAAVIALHIVVYSIVLASFPRNTSTGGWATLVDVLMWAQLIGFPLLLIAVSVATYRWRWTTGQYANLSLRRSAVTDEAMVRTVARKHQPSIWQSQFSLALRSMLPLKIATFAVFGLIAFANLPLLNSSEVSGNVFVFGGFACFLLGLTAFGSDQTPRTSFLADHGAVPRNIFWSRIAASGLFAFAVYLTVAVVVFATWQFGQAMFGMLVATGTAASLFALGVYGSIKFRTVLISFAAGAVLCLAVAIAISMSASFVGISTESQFASRVYRTVSISVYHLVGAVIAGCSIISAGILLIASFRSVRPWLVEGKPSGAMWYPMTCVLALATPVFLGATFGFLAFPSTTQSKIDQIVQQPRGNSNTEDYVDAIKFVSTRQQSTFARVPRLEQYYPPLRWAIERALVSQYESIPRITFSSGYGDASIDFDPASVASEEPGSDPGEPDSYSGEPGLDSAFPGESASEGMNGVELNIDFDPEVQTIAPGPASESTEDDK